MKASQRPRARITRSVISFITGWFHGICWLFFTDLSNSPAVALPSMKGTVAIFCLISASSSGVTSAGSVRIVGGQVAMEGPGGSAGPS